LNRHHTVRLESTQESSNQHKYIYEDIIYQWCCCQRGAGVTAPTQKSVGYWLLAKVLRPTQHNIGHFGDVPHANLLDWYRKTKPNTTKAHIYQSKKCTTTQNKHKKTKARFSRLLRHLAWKQSGSVLVLALHKFVTYLLTYLLK